MLFVSSTTAKQIQGTSVNIDPPEGYTESDRFAGFMNESLASSIVITELPAPYHLAIKGFSDEQQMKTKNMALLQKSQVTISGYNGMLFHVEQPAYGMLFKKWILAVERNKSTVLIVASYPETAQKQKVILKEAILNAKLSKASDPLEALGFTILPEEPFEIANTFAQHIILTPGGRFPIKDERVPFMVIGLSLSTEMPVPNKKQFAEERIKKVKTVNNVSIKKSVPVVVGDLPGYETIASANKDESSLSLTVYQLMLFDDSGYSIIQGLLPESERDKYLPIFKNIANTFKMKE
ncbi:MAG: hypothetical protein P8163_12610 [Candidatus Thiodiazotropha sp.]